METVKVWRRHRGAGVALAIGGCGVLFMGLLVAMGLRRSAPETFVPTSLERQPAGGRLVGPRLFTVDASAADRWQFFSFEDGSVVQNPGPRGWDLAFRRFRVIVNGGVGFAGDGGVAELRTASLDSVTVAPGGDYVVNTARTDTTNAVLEEWYDYSYISHLLSPRPTVYAVRTAEGRYALLQFVGYYCPGAVPGCVTFRYMYQGGGGVSMGKDLPEGPAPVRPPA